MIDPLGAEFLRHLVSILLLIAALATLALIVDRFLQRTLLKGRIGMAVVGVGLLAAFGSWWFARSLERSYRVRALERVAGDPGDFILRIDGRQAVGGPEFVQALRAMRDESFPRGASFGPPIQVELAGHGSVLDLRMQRELRHPFQYRVCVSVSNTAAACDQVIGMVTTSLLNGHGGWAWPPNAWPPSERVLRTGPTPSPALHD